MLIKRDEVIILVLRNLYKKRIFLTIALYRYHTITASGTKISVLLFNLQR